MGKIKDISTMNNNRGSGKGTFIVKIEHSHNNTWQGKVTWADENKQVRFRSALELIKLMDEALGQNQLSGEDEVNHSVL
ncbi:hypothetical protein [Butyrivibrio sp. YAB3001]|uniref:hypothetical protein n=1 Tax=Butyrivibrio sp. YAB3001 TaxID=1520812 RepID=UPI0008F67049|nr:hypothetical protein [Butyrivibrio sp. YAB3001]SFC64933.1 hypothetical protein SAMN02910398_02773 [Butyrivibrio sp. YAB3001]